ncbi:hypothetical protein LGN17_31430, partial [Burkholderia sp. AU30280]|nr:hypothetical protein [Burkholderia sp. AU30280]
PAAQRLQCFAIQQFGLQRPFLAASDYQLPRKPPRFSTMNQKNAAGRPREYSQTPSDEGNKQL